jgi:hypothetical protein
MPLPRLCSSVGGHPQQVVPGNGRPDQSVTFCEAYLYTLRK